MSDAPWCDLCDLPKGTCVHGLPITHEERQPHVPESPLDPDGPTILAQIEQPCVRRRCPIGMIEIGSSITHTADGWAHTECTTQNDQSDMFEGVI